MSTTARKAWLRILNAAGVKNIRSKSAFGLPYICYLGDFTGEAPFYNPTLSVSELAVMSAWCSSIESPVIFDIGANNGFISTQLAQLLRKNSPRIYAFEPAPSTFTQLRNSIDSLGLNSLVFPDRRAMSDFVGKARLFYDPRHSLFAQIRNDAENARVGTESAEVNTTTVDQTVDSLHLTPHLLKVDVEGFEPRVFKGAQGVLRGDRPPAICFEWNPLTLSEGGGTSAELMAELANYRLHYLDDFNGQRIPLGEAVERLTDFDWVANIFAVPKADQDRAGKAIELAKEILRRIF